MADPRQERRPRLTASYRGSLVNPVYMMGIFQLIMALIIGVVGMLASSRTCAFSIMWVYFFISLWYIVATSIGLSPTRRGMAECSLKYMKRTMKLYRLMCTAGLMFVLAIMFIELIGLFQEPEEAKTKGWSCVTIHLILVCVGVITVLVTIGGIVTSSRVIVIYTALQREEGSVSFSVQSNTISANLGQTNFALNPELMVPPAYSLVADLPPTYDDVMSGKADGLEQGVSDTRDDISRNTKQCVTY
ncbi:uncharacterized protein [Asterias amurensis]|uniref:uncharacterized protein isoform X2 n=1 Tax=Asterias amurensis TaxID=7602 RepID=UPI003AB5579A